MLSLTIAFPRASIKAVFSSSLIPAASMMEAASFFVRSSRSHVMRFMAAYEGMLLSAHPSRVSPRLTASFIEAFSSSLTSLDTSASLASSTPFFISSIALYASWYFSSILESIPSFVKSLSIRASFTGPDPIVPSYPESFQTSSAAILYASSAFSIRGAENSENPFPVADTNTLFGIFPECIALRTPSSSR